MQINIQGNNIPGAIHLPRILLPVVERFCAFIDFFHAAFRCCNNPALVKGFGERRPTAAEGVGGGTTLGKSLGQSTQKKP